MSKIITIIIWLLGGLVLAVVGFACTVVFTGWPLKAEPNPILATRLGLVPGIAIGTGVLMAILTYAREAARTKHEKDRTASQLLLERATIELKRVLALLSDGNNSRVTWIRAARALCRAKELSSLITNDDYTRAYVLEAEQVRDELYDVLSRPEPDESTRRALPPQFFYGLSDWDSDRPLDDEAIAASSSTDAYWVSIDKTPPEPSLRPLSIDSVAVIYKFLEYPEDWEDPLPRAGDWGSDWENAHGISAGAKRYVTHKRTSFAVGGKLHKKSLQTQ